MTDAAATSFHAVRESLVAEAEKRVEAPELWVLEISACFPSSRLKSLKSSVEYMDETLPTPHRIRTSKECQDPGHPESGGLNNRRYQELHKTVTQDFPTTAQQHSANSDAALCFAQVLSVQVPLKYALPLCGLKLQEAPPPLVLNPPPFKGQKTNSMLAGNYTQAPLQRYQREICQFTHAVRSCSLHSMPLSAPSVQRSIAPALLLQEPFLGTLLLAFFPPFIHAQLCPSHESQGIPSSLGTALECVPPLAYDCTLPVTAWKQARYRWIPASHLLNHLPSSPVRLIRSSF
ncbi:unnamed protein product [Symbiodinium natans]|uniref:Uncharacterized protein n=1 Tax=Symbiodinium natans TaxID=878477 RepID=A0A812IJ41_9DINO|nr:unnamed protein product [Symbiodinium natans]